MTEPLIESHFELEGHIGLKWGIYESIGIEMKFDPKNEN